MLPFSTTDSSGDKSCTLWSQVLHPLNWDNHPCHFLLYRSCEDSGAIIPRVDIFTTRAPRSEVCRNPQVEFDLVMVTSQPTCSCQQVDNFWCCLCCTYFVVKVKSTWAGASSSHWCLLGLSQKQRGTPSFTATTTVPSLDPVTFLPRETDLGPFLGGGRSKAEGRLEGQWPEWKRSGK